jgi:hypothetical protein
MVTTRSEQQTAQRNVQDRSIQDDAWTLNDPQATINLLNEKIAQMKKNIGDLADKNVALLACILEQSHTTTVVLEAEKEERNNHTGGRQEEDQSHPQVEADNRDGHRENNPEKNPPRKEKKEKLREVVGKLEQIVRGASTTRQRKDFPSGQCLAKDSLTIYQPDSHFFRLPHKFKVPDIAVYIGLKDPIEHLDNFQAHMDLHGTPDEVACRAFPLPQLGRQCSGLVHEAFPKVHQQL